MTWWVETFLNKVQDFYSLWVLVKTDQADHLFLSWAYHHPAREPILVLVRGVHKQCGYKYIWDTPTIVEQDTPGDTLVHQFHLLSLQAPSHIWFYIWAPGGPYGLEIQSPLHRADLSAVLEPPCNPLWTFDTNLQGWVVTSGAARWINDGSPAPGCIEMYSAGSCIVQSPVFDTSLISTMKIEVEIKHVPSTWGYLTLAILSAIGWRNLTTWPAKTIPWTHKVVTVTDPWKTTGMRVRLSRTSGYLWEFDTVCVKLYP